MIVYYIDTRATDETGMHYYVERTVNGRTEWLKIATPDEIWVGAFSLLGEITREHQPC